MHRLFTSSNTSCYHICWPNCIILLLRLNFNPLLVKNLLKLLIIYIGNVYISRPLTFSLDFTSLHFQDTQKWNRFQNNDAPNPTTMEVGVCFAQIDTIYFRSANCRGLNPTTYSGLKQFWLASIYEDFMFIYYIKIHRVCFRRSMHHVI